MRIQVVFKQSKTRIDENNMDFFLSPLNFLCVSGIQVEYTLTVSFRKVYLMDPS